VEKYSQVIRFSANLLHFNILGNRQLDDIPDKHFPSLPPSIDFSPGFHFLLVNGLNMVRAAFYSINFL
jgi:hypothetical protein